MKTVLTFVHALSPLHAGVGQGAGVIDLPIAREVATGLPFLPGSSLKGALRTRCASKAHTDASKTETCIDIFGADPNDEVGKSNRASSVLFTDQRLLLLPVRSIAGTFAWITSSYVLYRFLRDIAEAGIKDAPKATEVSQKNAGFALHNTCLVTEQSQLFLRSEKGTGSVAQGPIYLEDFDLSGQEDAKLNEWSNWLGKLLFPDDPLWQGVLNERFCLVHDDIFNFLSEHATEVNARIRLDDNSKTVTDGGLWYEETLPSESVLSGLLVVAPSQELRNKLTTPDIIENVQGLTESAIQLGGKATTGRGLCRVVLKAEKE